jgi:hypothetical protein
MEFQSKLDLLAVTEADREALTEQIKECLEQRVREARLNREAHALFARAPPPGYYSTH